MSDPQEAPPFRYELSQLLGDISKSSPVGDNLRYEGTYERIREARREDDAEAPRGVWEIKIKRADWEIVEHICVDALSKKSKDLQIAAWLLEAWIHLHGVSGLREGLRLQTALCVQYWEHLYPALVENDVEDRIAPLVWMNEKLPAVLRLLPITSPSTDDVPAYCWADWEGLLRPKPTEKLTQARFQQSAMLSSTAYMRNLSSETEDALHECAALEAVLDRCCGKASPSIRQVWKVLESILGFTQSILGQRGDEADESPTRDLVGRAGLRDDLPPDSAPDFSYTFAIRNRDEAYRLLAEAADYLARTEPHSPAPYLVRRAISWGSMSLDELLPEIVRNSGELGEIYRLLQIPGDISPPKK